MPFARGRPCRVASCPELQPCPVHLRRRLYDRCAWRRLARAFLVRHPWCLHCHRAGRLTLATEVDHVLPHHGDEALFWDEGNWQGLCGSCHATKTGEEDR